MILSWNGEVVKALVHEINSFTDRVYPFPVWLKMPKGRELTTEDFTLSVTEFLVMYGRSKAHTNGDVAVFTTIEPLGALSLGTGIQTIEDDKSIQELANRLAPGMTLLGSASVVFDKKNFSKSGITFLSPPAPSPGENRIRVFG